MAKHIDWTGGQVFINACDLGIPGMADNSLGWVPFKIRSSLPGMLCDYCGVEEAAYILECQIEEPFWETQAVCQGCATRSALCGRTYVGMVDTWVYKDGRVPSFIRLVQQY